MEAGTGAGGGGLSIPVAETVEGRAAGGRGARGREARGRPALGAVRGETAGSVEGCV